MYEKAITQFGLGCSCMDNDSTYTRAERRGQANYEEIFLQLIENVVHKREQPMATALGLPNVQLARALRQNLVA